MKVLFLLLSFTLLAQDETPEKTYTQKEVDEMMESKVNEAVAEKLKKVQIRNLSKYSQELLKKEVDLIDKEKKIVEREKQLERMQNDFSQKIKKFDATKARFIGCLDDNEKQKEERIGKVVAMISGMKPAKAAEILSVQDADLSVQILANLDAVKASKIFNLMDKEISATLQKKYLLMKQ